MSTEQHDDACCVLYDQICPGNTSLWGMEIWDWDFFSASPHLHIGRLYTSDPQPGHLNCSQISAALGSSFPKVGTIRQKTYFTPLGSDHSCYLVMEICPQSQYSNMSIDIIPTSINRLGDVPVLFLNKFYLPITSCQLQYHIFCKQIIYLLLSITSY